MKTEELVHGFMILEMSIRAITEICQEDVVLIHLPPSLNVNTIGNKYEA